ncbi:hypothetical protein E4634_00610 [Mangrovimicrobium sediminis]|uniref:Alpha/beta hydrolase n=1 Tax=Mangrovimicrobium sediminis TaxID=2562682 RepID=A0A4Z0M9M2_9GAMM|nr:hypothetical protein [Haliea sp. SAOS-164]TGD76086.1 hypothetical protein E4634_00610 [Haliea sp. SAOS-164]
MTRLKLVFSIFVVATLSGCASSVDAALFKDAEKLSSQCSNRLDAPRSGYGAFGDTKYDVKSLRNAHWRRKDIQVFLPAGKQAKAPVIFFSHAFGAYDWKDTYPDLMRNLASRGNIVVFVPYRAFGASNEKRYETLWDGFTRAVDEYGSRMDLSRVAFVGHSYGGGATPYMAYKGLVEKGWGSAGSYIFIMAPWYSFDITQKMLSSYPRDTHLVMQVYDEDDVNDHRMAIDLYNSIELPASNKTFLEVRSQSRNGCAITASHDTPARNPSLFLKAYGVFRPLDAMNDAVFHGNKSALDIVYGNGNSGQIEMGDWDDKQPFAPMLRKESPRADVPQDKFRFSWDDRRQNPRVGVGEPE